MSDDENYEHPISAKVRLETGQLAQIHEGTVRVISPTELPPHHFMMSVSHLTSEHKEGVAKVRAVNYESLLQFLKQLENLDYLLLNIERIEGAVPQPG